MEETRPMNLKNLAPMTLVATLVTMSLAPARAQVEYGGSSALVPAARVATFFQNFAAAAIPSAGKATVTKDGKAGVFAAYNPATGKAVALAGIGGSGAFTASASGKSGPCAAISGLAANKAGGGTETFTYYQLNCPSDPVPATAADADALFTQAFGPGSLRGHSLTTFKAGPYGRAIGLYWLGQETISWTNWYGVPVTYQLNVIRAVTLVNGKLCAIYATGSGTSWGAYAK